MLSPDIDETPAPRRAAARTTRSAWRAPRPPASAAAPGAYVLAADTVVAAGRRILPKAETEAEARACLDLLSGRRHRVMTAVVLVDAEGARARAAERERGRLRPADRGPDATPISPAANGAARPAATPSRARPRASSASSRAATPTSSGCRCSRPRSCCAAPAGRCRDARASSPPRSPGEVRVAVAEGDDAARLRDLAARRAGRRRRPASRPRHRARARDGGGVRRARRRRGLPARQRGRRGRTEGDSLAVRVTRAAQGGKGPRLTADAEAVPARSACPAAARAGRGRAGSRCAIRTRRCWSDDAALVAALRPVAAATGVAGRRQPSMTAIADAVEALARAVRRLLDRRRGLHIHPTPALVAIDVDAGRRDGRAAAQGRGAARGQPGRAARAGARRSGCATCPARSWSISPACPSASARTLGPALAAALAADPLRPRLLGFTALGLAEIVRPRVHPPLHELLAGPHAAGLAALRRIAAEAAAAAAPRVPAARVACGGRGAGARSGGAGRPCAPRPGGP